MVTTNNKQRFVKVELGAHRREPDGVTTNNKHRFVKVELGAHRRKPDMQILVELLAFGREGVDGGVVVKEVEDTPATLLHFSRVASVLKGL